MEKVTILMPIYNGIEYINDSITSVNFQTFTDWKLLIGINGHPANSDVYKKACEYKSDKIEVIDFDFGGKSKTLNSLIDRVNTSSIALLDVDDIWLPNKLQTQYEYLDNYDVVGTFTKYFGEKDIEPPVPFGHVPRNEFFRTNPVINSSALLKTDDAFWDESLSILEDYDMWLRLNKEGKRFLNIPVVLTYHRIHHDSFFNTQNHIQQEELTQTLRRKWA